MAKKGKKLADAAKDAADKVPAPSPNPMTNLILADIALRAGGSLLRRGVEKESLRARDPAWGVRDLEAVAALAATHGYAAPEVIPMPANNLTVAFRRAAAR